MTRQFYCCILDPENFETELTRKIRTSNFFYDLLSRVPVTRFPDICRLPTAYDKGVTLGMAHKERPCSLR